VKTLILAAALVFTFSTQTFCQTAEGYLEKGHTFLAHNKFLQAESQYLQALELNPQLGEARQRLGEISQGRQHYPAAIAHYKAALELQFNQPTTYIHLAFCQRKNGSIDKAIHTNLALIKMYPELPQAYLGLGGLYDAQGLKQKAEAAYSSYRALKH